MDKKVCKSCNEEKELGEFGSVNRKKKASGEEYIYYYPVCKRCTYKRDWEWKKNNRDKYNAIVKRTEKKNAEKRKAGRKQWRQENPDKIKEYANDYKQKQFKLTGKEWKACKLYFNNSCAYCGMTGLEAKEKYNKGLHKEHAINEGNNDLSNCVTSCTGCNSTKGKDDYTYWYTSENPIYNETRLEVIEKWLNEDHKEYIKNN